jgi:hypothetical protein
MNLNVCLADMHGRCQCILFCLYRFEKRLWRLRCGMRVQRSSTDVLNAMLLREVFDVIGKWDARARRDYGRAGLPCCYERCLM